MRLRDRVAFARAGARGALRWREPHAREHARRAIDAVAGPGPGRGRLAVVHLALAEAREELIRRPHAVPGVPAVGVEHLRRACASGRGVLVSYCHLGPFAGAGVTVSEHAERVHVVGGEWIADPPPDVPQPPRRNRWRAIFDEAGVPLVASEGGFERIRELLAGGAVVSMTFDWPGSAETCFLGRPVMLSSGAARLAAQTDALVVPLQRRWRRLRPVTEFAAPLDPRDHADWRGLHDALAAWHEHWIRARPAALEDPRRPGAWEERATAERWG